jgi:serine O-acetyltransferase
MRIRAPSVVRRLNSVVRRVVEQLDVIVERDPSIHSRGEAALHPTVPAIFAYRIAHRFHARGRYRTARALCTWARFVTGVEIHPGARIGDRFFIDHGSGVVIGETAVIGDDVTLFHHVTLGALGWWKDHARDPGQRRHPKVGNGVTVGAAAMLLGPITVGDNARVGAQALVVCDVPEGALVLAPKATIRIPRSSLPGPIGRSTDEAA